MLCTAEEHGRDRESERSFAWTRRIGGFVTSVTSRLGALR